MTRECIPSCFTVSTHERVCLAHVYYTLCAIAQAELQHRAWGKDLRILKRIFQNCAHYAMTWAPTTGNLRARTSELYYIYILLLRVNFHSHLVWIFEHFSHFFLKRLQSWLRDHFGIACITFACAQTKHYTHKQYMHTTIHPLVYMYRASRKSLPPTRAFAYANPLATRKFELGPRASC